MKNYFSKHINKNIYKTLMPQEIKTEHYLLSLMYNSRLIYYLERLTKNDIFNEAKRIIPNFEMKDINEFEQNHISNLVVKGALKVNKYKGENYYSVNNDQAFDIVKMYPSTIIKLITPLPQIMNKKFIFYLHFLGIDPLKYYNQNHHEQILEWREEILYFLDRYRTYYEFIVNKEYAQTIKSQNENLYSLSAVNAVNLMNKKKSTFSIRQLYKRSSIERLKFIKDSPKKFKFYNYL